MSEQRLKYLFGRYLEGACLPEEKEELAALTLEPANAELVKELVNRSWDLTGREEDMPEEKSGGILQSILHQEPEVASVHSTKIRRINWQRLMVAASILLAIGLGSYFLFFNKPVKSPAIAISGEPNDVAAPVSNIATITLANGKRIFLDSAGNGELAVQHRVKLIKTGNGQVIYQPAESAGPSGIQYNTLTNPRGSRIIDLVLADGTQVWLNAGSSLTYPVAFVSNERKVSITGEAYFEVAHDASKPFRVSKGDMEVTVLGTHFNINAYDDEENIKVTLLEGAVKTAVGKGQSALLRPGQQAIAGRGGLKVENHVDLDQVMAWKNGLFQFHHADLPTVMRQLSCWYDVDIVYEGKTPVREFEGKMERGLRLSQVLKILEKNQVHFRIEGKKLIVEQ